MAIGQRELPILGGIPDPTNPPGVEYFTGITGTRAALTFDGTAAIEAVQWTFRLPSTYASGLKLNILWAASSSTTISHTVQWSAFVMALTPDVDGAVDTDSYDSENVVSDDVLGTTAKRIQIATVVCANADSVAAGDYVSIRMLRDYSDAADDLAEDAWVVAVELEWTTA